jgi:hypothetical protein
MPNIPYFSSSATAASVPFGGITITINAITYITENWKPEKNTREIRRNGTTGDRAEFSLRAEPTSQSGLTLQLALASTAVPSLGAEFTVDTLVYVVTKVSQSKGSDAFWFCDIDYVSKALPTD